MVPLQQKVLNVLINYFLLANFIVPYFCSPLHNEHDEHFGLPAILPARRKGRCESITNHMCKDIGYNETVFPNYFLHNSQHDAGRDVKAFEPLVKINCSQNVKLFICALYFPPCTIIDPPIKPCRSVCLSTKKGCESILKQFSYEWPQAFNCSALPEEQPCVTRDDSGVTASDAAVSRIPEDKGWSADNHPNPFVRDRFVCPTHFKTPRELNYAFRLNGKFYPECGTPCDNFIYSVSTREIVRNFIMFFSILCLISVSLTLVIFFLSKQQYDFLHRALASMAFCYLVISILYIVGFFVGDSITCNQPFPPPDHQQNVIMIRTLTQGTHKQMCTFTFMLLFFAQNASFLWFILLSFTWFLTTFSAWGPESLDKSSGIFHSIVWGLSGVGMIWHMAYKKIQGDVLSGVCFLGILDREKRYIPWDSASTVQISISLLFFLLSSASSWRIRKYHKKYGREIKQMDSFILKLTIFSIFYICSSIILIGCYAYEERNMDLWIRSWQARVCREPNHGIPCPLFPSGSTSTPQLWFLILKYAAQLLPGIMVIMPFISGNNVKSWWQFVFKVLKCRRTDPRKPPTQAISLDKFNEKT